ncbi:MULTISPECIES: hypothetical protein [Saccharopolyspora]|uniref:Asp23/Gls24 family envelope stress response protein n=1 Tax=Saccharopolyspora cebuensis TaxID=418759 RepID=A0ABV4CNY4_9PSEU
MSGPAEPQRVLPCGRPAAALVALLGDPAEADPELREHVRGCRFCTDEFAALDRQWQAVRQAAAAPVEVPEGLVSRALETVRGLRGTAEPVELAQPGGRLRILPRPLLLLVRQVATDVLRERPGVHLRGLHGGDRWVELTIAVRYGLEAVVLAESVREQITERLEGSLGAATPVLSVRVGDVLEPE